jgi:hypothetical protein
VSKPDDFDRLRPEARAILLRAVATDLLGAEKAARVVEQLEPGVRSRARQAGDAPVPEQNHWRGAWRIYELDGPGEP